MEEMSPIEAHTSLEYLEIQKSLMDRLYESYDSEKSRGEAYIVWIQKYSRVFEKTWSEIMNMPDALARYKNADTRDTFLREVESALDARLLREPDLQYKKSA